ncbi:sugar O-acetyltransferase [Marinobacter szutsaonensis]
MYGFIKSLFFRLIVAYKYRDKRFEYEGVNSSFKGLTSKFLYSENISIGDNVHIGPRAMFDGAGGIKIEEGCIFAPEIKIYSRTHNFDQNLQALPYDNVMLVAPVNIGRYTWVGANVIILPGVTIGEGSIIGAGSVVSRSVPAYAVAVGNPARVVKFRDSMKFHRLLMEPVPFVYRKFGHAKTFKKKNQ